MDGVLFLGVSSTSITLSVTGVGLVVVPIVRGLGAGVCIFSELTGEYQKTKEQHIIKKLTIAGKTLHDFCKLH